MRAIKIGAIAIGAIMIGARCHPNEPFRARRPPHDVPDAIDSLG
jgi:hypothetical protein